MISTGLICGAFSIFVLIQAAFSTNYNQNQPYSGDNQTQSYVLVDKRQPHDCNSPGWEKNPGSIKAVLRSYVHFQCQNRLPHNKTFWLVNGRKKIQYTNYASRISIQDNGRSLRFGPVMNSDDGLGINCEVITKYGALPSPLGVIRVILPPMYSPSGGSALLTKPYYFDFKYSGSLPDHYTWYKNGYIFKGEPGRVIVDSHGITFTRILQRDSGLYYVKSYNKAGSASGSAYLRVLFWWRNGTQYQHAASSNPDIPINVAVAIAVDTAKRELEFDNHKQLTVSSVDSTANAFKLMKRLNNKATNTAKQQGKSRQQIEKILKQIVSLVGHPLVNFQSQFAESILNVSHCQEAVVDFNCKDEKVLKYRTINGTCNNLFFPLNGAAHVPFARLLPADYEDGISQPNGHKQAVSGNAFSGPWPSPRHISWNIINDLQQDGVAPMSHMFMGWGQFIDHDLDLAPIFDEDEVECDCNYTSRCIPIPVKSNDPIFGDGTLNMGECLTFTRSIPVCTTNGQGILRRNQINQLTSFIDASQVYGSDDELAMNLRLGVGGLLREGGRTKSKKGNLPFQEEKPVNGDIPFFEAGDERANEQVGLTVLHTIWMREHNRLARELSKLNPCWNDERIYQESRKIVGAMLQVITYNEFLPMLFGSYFREYVPQYGHYNPFIDATIPNEFAAAAFRFGHSLIRPFLMRLDENYIPVEDGPLPLEKAFFNPIEYFRSNGTDPILRGLIVAKSMEVDEFLNSILTSKLFNESPQKLGTDLASLNIQRGRDHGLASYRKWQQFCEAVFPGKNSTFKNPNTETKLRRIYGDKAFREGMDLWVGGLAEKKLPGAQVGPTLACIIGLTFSKVRDGDRFWYQNPHIFHTYQLRELQKVTLSKVICDNSDNITDIQQNAFRTDQTRVPCDTLDDLNLLNWKDFKCISHKRFDRSFEEDFQIPDLY